MKRSRKYLNFVYLLVVATATLLVLSLARCSSSEPEETATPPPPTSTEPPTPEVTVTPEYQTFLPTDEQIASITAGIQANEPPQTETGHVLPPDTQMDTLETICGGVAEVVGLLNPECIFNRAWATSYTLPDTGMVYQLVSLPAEAEADGWLEDVDGWGANLAIGGLLVYQQVDFAEFSLDPGVYLAVLQNDLTFQLYNENIEPVAEGEWQLRQLNGRAAAPVALVTPNQLCYGQLVYQTCLNLASPGIGADSQNAEIINTAVSNLQETGWLPANVTVHTASALSSIEGSDQTVACTAMLAEGEYQDEICFPSLVVAAAEPVSDTLTLVKGIVTAKNLSSALQVTGTITEVVTAVGVLEVLETMNGEAFDLDGQIVDLEVGSYRVDLLGLVDGAYLFQLISNQGTPLYLAALAAPGEGEPINTSGEPDTSPDAIIESETTGVLIDAIVWKVCRTYGWGYICGSNPVKRWAYWCVAWSKSGWCYANGAFIQ